MYKSKYLLSKFNGLNFGSMSMNNTNEAQYEIKIYIYQRKRIKENKRNTVNTKKS